MAKNDVSHEISCNKCQLIYHQTTLLQMINKILKKCSFFSMRAMNWKRIEEVLVSISSELY